MKQKCKSSNEISYNHVKSQFQMFPILSNKKMTKSVFFRYLKSLCSDIHICYFCVAQKIHCFQLKICSFVRYISGYIMIFSYPL
jgi:hypothetical protein